MRLSIFAYWTLTPPAVAQKPGRCRYFGDFGVRALLMVLKVRLNFGIVVSFLWYQKGVFIRELAAPSTSFFLFGPRGTGKTTWLSAHLGNALRFDLLDPNTYGELSLQPSRLAERIAAEKPTWVVLDEIQKLPSLLDVVHQLHTSGAKALRFALTGSSARKLKRGGANLLAGRAVTREMHALTAAELGPQFSLEKSVRVGQLPGAYRAKDADDFLTAYVGTYLKEEVQAEALVRRLDVFTRFLQAAAFSQASQLNAGAVGRDLGLDRKTVAGYFDLLEDLLLGVRLPVFTRKAKRKTVTHPKFYYFDAGVFRTLRPKGPLDSVEDIDGAALETLVFQNLRATNANLRLGYDLFYFRTRDGSEVDFVLYGERGLYAFEVKRAARFRAEDLRGLHAFRSDYPMAQCFLLYTGADRYESEGVQVLPISWALPRLANILQLEQRSG